MFVTITGKCDRKCNYCYNKGLIDNFPPITLDNFRKIIDWSDKQGLKTFTLTGGEPTTHPRINDIIKIIEDKGFKIILLTNGLFKKNLIEIVKPYFVSFGVNYNPPNEYSKKEKKIIERNLRDLSENKFNITLKYNIRSSNMPYKYLLDMCKKYKIKYVNVSFIMPNSTHTNEFVQFKELNSMIQPFFNLTSKFIEKRIQLILECIFPKCMLKQNFKNKIKWINKKIKLANVCRCGTKHTIAINPDLSIYPCPLVKPSKRINLLNFGDIDQIEMYFNKKLYKLRWEIPLIKECESCVYWHRKQCHGGCLSYH